MSVNPDSSQGEVPFNTEERSPRVTRTPGGKEVPQEAVQRLFLATVVVIPYDGTEPFVADPAKRHVPNEFWTCGVV